MRQPVDPALCPLCGEPNACALAASPEGAAGECWCASRTFDARLLARVAPEGAERACICSRCQRSEPRASDPG